MGERDSEDKFSVKNYSLWMTEISDKKPHYAKRVCTGLISSQMYIYK